MTGKNVRRVDVIVEGVRLPTERENTADKTDDLWPDPLATD
jgi:uncharacterized alkaline shock family protein YloU